MNNSLRCGNFSNALPTEDERELPFVGKEGVENGERGTEKFKKRMVKKRKDGIEFRKNADTGGVEASNFFEQINKGNESIVIVPVRC
jgi:hypothetical protein